MDDKVKAIEILQDEVVEKQRQIKLIMDLDLSGQVTEEIWHRLCRTPLRTSRLFLDIVKSTFPDAEDIELQEQAVKFNLYGIDCYLPTTDELGIGIDLSWYQYIRQYGKFADEMDQECKQIVEYLNIQNPTTYDRVDFVYPFKPGHMKVFYYNKSEKDKLWREHNDEIINRTDPERLQRIVSVKMIQFEEEKKKQAEKLRVQRQKVDILRDKVIPYLRQFTEKIYSYTDELSLRKTNK
ncbi:MAG: hypothetical protein U0L06_03620 [Agathobacter sp.]|nr:hypothetical protein [Agathobacter sp.]